MKNGSACEANGRAVDPRSAEAHIPLPDFRFRAPMMDPETWLRRIRDATRDVADEDYQERVWLRGEGPRSISSTEAVCRLVDDYDLPTFLAEAADTAWISNDQLTALGRLDAALTRYAINGEDADDARTQTPGWQKSASAPRRRSKSSQRPRPALDRVW